MNRIRDLRLQRNWNQEELGARLNVGKGTISRYENEERSLDSTIILTLCDIFGVTADYLLCRSNSPSAAMTDDEADLLRAYRVADDRTRTVVNLTLEPFKAHGNSNRKSAVS